MAEPSTLEYDVVVIGGGPVGENVAQYATEGSGLTAVLVEGELLGGECSYWACMPSKALLRPFDVATMAEHVGGLSRPDVDRQAVLARRDEFVSGYDDAGQVEWAESAGLEVVRGHGRLAGERLVEVDGQQLRAWRAVVLATGSDPMVPDLYTPVVPWGSRDATGVVEVPDRLIVIGGGVVACEAATWLAGLGSAVTMLVRNERLLSGQEPSAAAVVLDGLRAAGVDVRLGEETESCTRDDAADTGIGRVHGGAVTVRTQGGTHTADEILVATGRRPRLDDLGLDAVDLTAEQVLGGDLPDWLHVVGDASGEAPLTHWGKYRARVVGEQIAASATGQEPAVAPPEVPVPQVVFTDPQLAAVGYTEQQARDAARDVVTAEIPFASAAGASLLRDDPPGVVKIVVDTDTRALVGAVFVGPDAGELLHAATIAITAQTPVHVLRHAVPTYPTASELWLRLLEELPRELRRG